MNRSPYARRKPRMNRQYVNHNSTEADMAKSKTTKQDTQAFFNEGVHARNAGQPRTACPYSMSGAVVGGAVLRAHLIARTAWMAGYDSASEGRGE